ncbi:MAG: DUF4962 domain-containing protein [Ruminococcaceae bacterium]|nr:DUF4962 domain-containing protein [Oscillospiraceae bacterium]
MEKKTVRKLLVLASALMLFGSSACTQEIQNTETSAQTTMEAADVILIQDRKTDYKLIYGTSSLKNARSAASDLAGLFLNNCGIIMSVNDAEKTPAASLEIIFGRTDRPLSAELADAVEAYPKTSYVWGIAYRDGIAAVYANSDMAFKEFCLMGIKELYLQNKSFILKENLWAIHETTEEEYLQMLRAEEEAKAARKLEERKALLAEVKAELAQKKVEDFGGEVTVLTDESGNSMPVYPKKGQHPRLLFTEKEIPAILAALDNPENKENAERFLAYADMEITGKLPPPKENIQRLEINNSTQNFDAMMLQYIQAKALYYALTNDTMYGEEAICAIKNYLLTLDILSGSATKVSRETGYAMYVTACVYDWCYDLLSDTDKEQLIRGLEYSLCRTEVTREYGFPPTGYGAFTGHGSEYMVNRDFLSAAIAIYDEKPDWYHFFAGDFFARFIPVREVFYEADMYPQGLSYGSYRFVADMYAAWLFKGLGYELPYAENMAKVVHSFAANAATNNKTFRSGDGGEKPENQSVHGYAAIISSYVFNDPVARAIAKDCTLGYSVLTSGYTNVTVPEFIILSSPGFETPETAKPLLPKILYNGSWLGQFITRNTWEDNAAITFAKIGQRSTANHDHQDHGTFQIYYKGLLSGDSGVYELYGTDHWRYYHQSTVAHNGLLIFDPGKYIPGGTDANGDGKIDTGSTFWYTGGQRYTSESASLVGWQNSKYDYAALTGVKSGYKADGKTPAFSYIAGDITKAYPTDTVDYVSRSMLTAYTEDAEFPMVFFVFDRIDAREAHFKKTFLLHVNGTEAPVISGNTVTITNGGGKLVNTSLLGGDEIVPLGGKDAAGNPQNFLINGVQCNDPDGKTDEWGRVEISPAVGSKSDLLLNVLYVTDKTQTKTLTPVHIASDNSLLQGASVAGITAMFGTDREKITAPCTFTVSGSDTMTYYIGGLAAGTWDIMLDGRKITSVSVSAEESLITFRAGCGTVSITRVQ